MAATWISASGYLYLGAPGNATLGTVCVLMQGTTWTIFSATSASMYPGHSIGICMSQLSVPGTPIVVQTFGIVPPDYYLAGGGSAGTIVANASGGISRGNIGTVIGYCDASGFITLTGNVIGSGNGGAVIGNIAGYPLSLQPLSQGQFWSYDVPSQTLVPTFVTSQLGVYGADLAGSLASTQYVQSISGYAGLGGPVTVSSSAIVPATDLYTTLGTPATFRFSTVYTQSIQGGTHATTGPGNSLLLQAENANGIGLAGGDVYVSPGLSGASKAGVTRFTLGGGTATTMGAIGNVPLLPYGALWLSSTAGMATPTSVNYALMSDGSSLAANAISPSGKFVIQMVGSTLAIVGTNSSATALWLSGQSNSANYALQSDGVNLWLNSISTAGYLYGLNGGVTTCAHGVLSGSPTLWIGSAAPSATNYTAYVDGTNAVLNAPLTTGAVYQEVGGAPVASFKAGGLGGSGIGTAALGALQYQSTQIPITTGTYTLTAAQAGCPSIAFYSTLTGNCTVVVPQTRSLYMVDMTSVHYGTFQVTFQYAIATKAVGLTSATQCVLLYGNSLDHLYGSIGS